MEEPGKTSMGHVTEMGEERRETYPICAGDRGGGKGRVHKVRV